MDEMLKAVILDFGEKLSLFGVVRGRPLLRVWCLLRPKTFSVRLTLALKPRAVYSHSTLVFLYVCLRVFVFSGALAQKKDRLPLRGARGGGRRNSGSYRRYEGGQG